MKKTTKKPKDSFEKKKGKTIVPKSKGEKKVYYLLIIDKSGSMKKVQVDTIDGFNEEIQSIRNLEKKFPNQKYRVSLVTFSYNDSIKYDIWNEKVSAIKELTEETYQPDGKTALLDAIGFSVNKLKKEIEDDLKSGNASVIVTIMTDGKENDSVEYNAKGIRDYITELQKDNKWVFTYMGCDASTIKDATDYGISRGNVLKFEKGKMKKASNIRAKMSGVYAATLNSVYASGVSTAEMDFSHIMEDAVKTEESKGVENLPEFKLKETETENKE